MPLAVNAVSVGGCETMHMPAAALHEMMSGDRELSLAISHVISRHACQMAELLLMQTGQSLGSRVLTVIRRLAAQKTVARREGAAVLKISQSDIARAAGASRQRVNIELHRLHELGYVRLGYREIALLDPPPLQE
jgi:CRP-like cAMP-binding protein